jgi:hypothetical protein
MRPANESDARQGNEIYRHSQPHTILSVELGGTDGPHVRVACPRELPSCRGLVAIGQFQARDNQ